MTEKLSITGYDADGGLQNFDSLSDLSQCDSQMRVWVDIQTKDPRVLGTIASHFDLHELTVEDCLVPGHFPKLEDFGSYVFMVFRGLKTDLTYAQAAGDEPLEADAQEVLGEDPAGKQLTYKIAIYLGSNFLITFRRQEVPWLEALVRQVKASPESFFQRGIEVLGHKVIDVLTDRFLRALGIFDRVIDGFEDLIIERPQDLQISKILELKRKLAAIRLIMRDQRAVIVQLASEGNLIRERHHRRYFKDIDDHAVSILNTLDKQIDEVVALREAYFAQVNVRLGDIMRILAVIATITAPLNVVVGIYGMNFDAIPLLHNPIGFWLVVSALALLVALMLVYFKRKHWL